MNYIEFQQRIKKALSKEFGEVIVKDITMLVNHYSVDGHIEPITIYNLKFTIDNLRESIFEDAEIVEDEKLLTEPKKKLNPFHIHVENSDKAV